MTAYIIVDVTILDKEQYEKYKALTPGSVAAYQGEFIVRGGNTDVIEGKWQPGRIVIVKFPSPELARQWWGSRNMPKRKLSGIKPQNRT